MPKTGAAAGKLLQAADEAGSEPGTPTLSSPGRSTAAEPATRDAHIVRSSTSGTSSTGKGVEEDEPADVKLSERTDEELEDQVGFYSMLKY